MAETILDQNKRLSESLLWSLQYKAYCQFGIEAWSRHGVPSYITSNSYIAKCYAHVVLGYLRDGLKQNIFDLQHPLYCLDLGAGTGRFAYLFLKELFRLIDGSGLPQIQLCYVMTDIAASNIEFWQSHPYFKPYFEQGILDCAYFHHEQKEPIHLNIKNISLTSDVLFNPLIVLANYFFDTIPQDLFRVQNGVLEEGRITLTTSENHSKGANDPNIIDHLKYRYSYSPLTSSNYYEEPSFNTVLDAYCRQFEGSTFLFPVGAFQVIQTLKMLSNERLLLLAGDQGVCTPQQVKEWGEPKVSLHGSFSMSVSYHAIKAFINSLEGDVLFSTSPDPAFVVMAMILNQRKVDRFHETRLAFQEHIDHFEPADYWNLVMSTEKKWENFSLDHALLLIKLGNWDPMILHAFFPMIRKWLQAATLHQKRRLAHTIHRTWKHYYPVAAEEGAFIVNLGVLFFDMKLYEEACIYFQRALDISGTNAEATKNLNTCLHILKSNLRSLNNF